MPDERASDLRRFVSDLRALREDRGVSLQRIQSDTRIPTDVLRQFEETGLEGNRTFNRVYLRSLVRTYAQSIGVPPDGALAGLEAAFENRYGGLSIEPAAEAYAAPDPETDAPAAEEVPEAGPVDPVAGGADETPRETEPEALNEGGRRVVQAGPAYDPGPTGSVFDTVPDRPGLPSWAYGLLVLLALAAAAAAVFWWMGRTPPQVVQPGTPAVEDTTMARPDSLAAPAPPAVLPDTLRLTVRATGGKLSPFRVTVDADARRPYWLNAEETQDFTFRDSVTVSGLTPTATLTVLGAPVTPAMRQADGSVRIRRADLQSGQ